MFELLDKFEHLTTKEHERAGELMDWFLEQAGEHLRRVFANRVRYSLINKQGMSQLEISKTLGISPSTLSRILNGQRIPSAEQLERLAQELTVMPSALYIEAYRSFLAGPTLPHQGRTLAAVAADLSNQLASGCPSAAVFVQQKGDSLTVRELRLVNEVSKIAFEQGDPGADFWVALIRLFREKVPNQAI